VPGTYFRDAATTPNLTLASGLLCTFTMINTAIAPLPAPASTSSINVLSQGSYNSLTEGSSGLRVDNQTTGANSGWVQGQVNWNSVGLGTNTEYDFATRARNGDGLEAPIGPTASAYTQIEAPLAPTAAATSTTTIDVQSQGTYSNLTSGSSGLRVDNLTQGTNSGWVQGQVNWTSTGLTPNTEHTFVGLSRNGDGFENPAGPTAAVHTHAEVPAPAAFGTVTHLSAMARWSANGNPAGTEYFVENTTTGADSGWTTDLDWLDSSTGPSAVYSYQGKARNAVGLETGNVPLGDIETPFWGDGFESGDTSAWSDTTP